MPPKLPNYEQRGLKESQYRTATLQANSTFLLSCTVHFLPDLTVAVT